MKPITATDFHFPGQTNVYRGKVREVYSIDNDLLIMVATDRLSAFDVVLPRGIPFKGQVLNQTATHFLQATRDIVDNWMIDTPDPNVAVGHRCQPIKLEMVIRGYLTGHAWRVYKSGSRKICGVNMPDGMQEHQKFEEPIITPATKADEGHDEDISYEEILENGIVDRETLDRLYNLTQKLYARGVEMARENGLILVDTKYEFGWLNGEIVLMDEIHTPDSSRYFYLEGYEDRQEMNLPQEQLSKEFVREWLMENGFSGGEDQQIPEMTDEFVERVSHRYIDLYETVTGKQFQRPDDGDPLERIRKNVEKYLSTVSGDS